MGKIIKKAKMRNEIMKELSLETLRQCIKLLLWVAVIVTLIITNMKLNKVAECIFDVGAKML